MKVIVSLDLRDAHTVIEALRGERQKTWDEAGAERIDELIERVQQCIHALVPRRVVEALNELLEQISEAELSEQPTQFPKNVREACAKGEAALEAAKEII